MTTKQKIVEIRRTVSVKKPIAVTEQGLTRFNKIKNSKPAEKDFLLSFFNRQRDRGFTTHVHKSSDKASTDVFEILCLAMGIVGIIISWIPFVGFVTPAVSFMSAYKTRKNTNFRMAGIILSLVSIIICASIMITLAVKPSVFGI